IRAGNRGPSAEAGTAFLPVHRHDLDRVFSIQHERIVARDNTIQFGRSILQLPETNFRATSSGCRVVVYGHLDRTIRKKPPYQRIRLEPRIDLFNPLNSSDYYTVRSMVYSTAPGATYKLPGNVLLGRLIRLGFNLNF